MAKYLVIVESPAKVKTIKKFLGANYDVEASNGHVRDFPKSQFGIDVEHDFEPKYITIRGKGELLAKLRKAAKKADKIYLATDPDREGEAISWHLMQALKEDPKKMHRITFNEITKTAVKSSIKQARDLDMDLVDAQQARRMLDRMVGYTISPLLWAKVKRGLSAGRVQSVALRIICDREDEINAFIPEEYWSLEGDFQVKGEKKPLQAKFYGTDKKMDIHSKEEMDKLLASLKDKEYEINEVKKGERIKNAPLPFTTSTLQQEAAKTLNFSTQKTMRLAQQLYEGIDIKGNGTVGVISYLRTDSTRISEEADAAAREYITAQYGEDYVSKSEKAVKKGQKIQDAHEAIRPTDISRTPAVLKESLSRDQFRLYQLIWRRFAASRMAPAKYETTSVKIGADQYIFTVSASKIIFDGFMSVYTDEEDQKKGNVLNQSLEKGMKLSLKELKPEQHFTQPPAHYTEASLVKTMEELGIGRPSTYAPTITTIISRRYVAKEQKNLYVTELGEVVNNIMKQAFPSIVDVNFTATMEGLLDCVAAGTVKWKTVVSNFYPDLKKDVDAAEDRELFDEILEKTEIPRAKGQTVFTVDEALKAANELGYPVLVRPSYVLGGQGMQIAVSDEDVVEFMNIINRIKQDHPILVDKYLMGKEIEVDAVCDGQDILIPGIMEHIERAGIHSGDSISVYPAKSISPKIVDMIEDYTGRLARALHVKGMINIQFIVYNDQVYVIEVNPRSSRTVPYISKVTGIPIVKLATQVIIGKTIKELGYEPGLQKAADYYAIKMPVFSFEKIRGADISLGPEMKSTGECLGISKSFDEALYKAFEGAGIRLPKHKQIIMTLADKDKQDGIDIAQRFEALGYKIYASRGTAKVLKENGVHAIQVNKIGQEAPTLLDLILEHKIDLVIDTPENGIERAKDGFLIRRYAIETGVHCLTSLDTAHALISSLEHAFNNQELSIVDIAQIDNRGNN